MVQHFDRCSRRFLNLPAVHPCESVSSSTLLKSLITLARNICIYRSKFFATHKKITRETFRKVEILLIFFEEIENCEAGLSDSIVVSFSELHVVLEKILYLFEDCTRGARLYVLMKSQFITTQFQVLIESIAVFHNVIPLNKIEISCEVRELIELVAKQARRARLETDSDDETAMERVNLILNKFENKFEPDWSIIKGVLDYLGIKTWGECHEEIKFIDDEINIECLEGTNREVPLMSSLSGFLSYCRVVIFEDGEFGKFNRIHRRNSFEICNYLNPEDFRCPISLELMADPVTVCTGQTYDRISIQKWLKSGNLICPTTGEKLANTNLVPNMTLRKLILQFCAENGISFGESRKKNRDITGTNFPGSPSSAQSIKFLSEFISERLYFGTEKNKNKAAYEIRLLAKSNIFNRGCLIEAGTVPPLLYLLNSIDFKTQENAIAALLKLSKHESGKTAIIENGGLKLIISVLKNGLNLENRQIAAATVFYLTSVNEYRKLIGMSREAIPALLKLIKEGTNFGKKNAIVAIFGLILHKSNQQRVLSAGIVPILIEILGLKNGDEFLSDSLAVLSMLAESDEGSIAISKTSSLNIFINLLMSSNSRVDKEYIISILLALCNNCGANLIAQLAKESSLMGLLYSITTDGNSHSKKKARALIKILHGYHEMSSSLGLRNGVVSHERSINVR